MLSPFNLPWWLKPLLIAALAGYGLYAAEQFGYQRAATKLGKDMATLEAGYNRQLLGMANTRLQEQAAAHDAYQQQVARGNAITTRLLQTQQQLDAAQRQLKQRIPNVTLTDGPRFTGLGPDSLRLYRQLLGYPASGEADLPAAHAGNADQASQAAGTAAGLPPADLLAHAGDYGKWCQQLDERLSAFITLHQPGATP